MAVGRLSEGFRQLIGFEENGARGKLENVKYLSMIGIPLCMSGHTNI